MRKKIIFIIGIILAGSCNRVANVEEEIQLLKSKPIDLCIDYMKYTLNENANWTEEDSISMVAPDGDEGEGNNEEEDEKGIKIPLRVNKENPENEEPIEKPYDRSLVFIPKVYLNAHTLTFVTPCTGGVVEILQQGTVLYTETVTAQTMLLPSALQGTYELQLTWCGVTYTAEITL